MSEKQSLSNSLLFLKSIITGLGIVLVVGFVYVIGVLLLGGKYFTERAKFEPYNLAKKIELSPLPKGEVISVRTSPIGVEVLSKQDKKIILFVYDGNNGDLFSEVIIK